MKNKLFILLVLALSLPGITVFAQSGTDSAASIKPEKLPGFKGGLNAWTSFLENNLDRDLLQRAGAPAGKYKVVADFMIEPDGKVSDIIIETDPGYGTADEMKRILKLSSKKWIPAFDKGKAIAYRNKQSLTLNN